MLRLFGFIAVLMLPAVLAPAAQAAICSQPDISRAAAQLQDARSALIELPRAGNTDPVLAASAQAAIAEMKIRLAGFVLAYMRCQSATADVQGIGIDLSRLGWGLAFDPARRTEPVDSRPGWTLAFDTRPLAGDLIGITATFGVPCGGDTMLILFQYRNGEWREVLRAAAGPYSDVGQAYQSFDYAVSPAQTGGGWYVIEKHLSTTCRSSDSQIAYAVLLPVHGTTNPKVVFTASDAHNASGDDIDALSVGADGFEIRYRGKDGVPVVRRYSVAGSVVRPIGQTAP